jgi:hypothetical protein
MYSSDLPLRQGSIYKGPLHNKHEPDQAGGQEPRDAHKAKATTPVVEVDASTLHGSSCESAMGVWADPTKRRSWLAATVHLLACALCLSTAMDLYNGSLFCWHPVLATLGFVGFMSEGMLIAVNFRHFEGPRRVLAIQIHACVQLAALASIAVGFWAIWQNKVRSAPAWCPQ